MHVPPLTRARAQRRWCHEAPPFVGAARVETGERRFLDALIGSTYEIAARFTIPDP